MVLQHGYDRNSSITRSSILENLSLVVADVKKRNLQGKAILNLSFGGGNYTRESLRAYRTAMSNILVDNDIVVVAPSGNEKVRYPPS